MASRDPGGFRRLGAAVLLALCLGPVGAARALAPDEARHLAARIGFGPTAAEIMALLPLTREQAVDAVIGGITTAPTVAPPDWVNGSPDDPDNDAHRAALAAVWYNEIAS